MDWKQKPIHELVETILKLIKLQHKDVERAFISRGPYHLHPNFEKFKVDPDVYIEKTPREREKYWRKFMTSEGTQTKDPSQVSTDGRLVVPRTPSGGKKPSQKKAKRSERTTSKLKMRK